MYVRITTKQFRKDVKRLEKSGFHIKKLAGVIDLLVTGGELPAQYKDHELKGAAKGSENVILLQTGC